MIELSSLQPATLGMIVFALLIAVRVGVLWFLASAAAGLATALNYGGIGEKLTQLSQTGFAEILRLVSQ